MPGSCDACGQYTECFVIHVEFLDPKAEDVGGRIFAIAKPEYHHRIAPIRRRSSLTKLCRRKPTKKYRVRGSPIPRSLRDNWCLCVKAFGHFVQCSAERGLNASTERTEDERQYQIRRRTRI